MMIRKIVGDSMLPGYQPGNTVWGWRWFRPVRLRPGRVVVIMHNDIEKVKRIVDVRHHGRELYVVGDNPDASTDSRHFGWISKKQVLAVVVWPRRSAMSE